MVKAMNCILLILILLLTALFGLIALLLVATEQPDSLLDRLYGDGYQVRTNETVFKWPPSRIKTSTSTLPISLTITSLVSTSTLMTTTINTTINTTNASIEGQKITTIELVQLPIKLKLITNEKVMSIGMKDKYTFYVAKMNGELEFFNWTNLESIQIEHLTVPIHRLDFLKDGRLVVTETQNKTLNLLDSGFKAIVQLKLAYQPLDLKVYNEMIYVLSRLNGTIFIYDNNLVQKFKISWNKEASCNFIQPVDDFVYVSCDNAVLRLSTEGKVTGRATIPGSLYSLSIFVPPNGKELWSVQRGKQEIDVYDKELQFKYKLAVKGEENAVWSAIGFGEGRVFALDYVSNSIKFFVINVH